MRGVSAAVHLALAACLAACLAAGGCVETQVRFERRTYVTGVGEPVELRAIRTTGGPGCSRMTTDVVEQHVDRYDIAGLGVAVVEGGMFVARAPGTYQVHAYNATFGKEPFDTCTIVVTGPAASERAEASAVAGTWRYEYRVREAGRVVARPAELVISQDASGTLTVPRGSIETSGAEVRITFPGNLTLEGKLDGDTITGTQRYADSSLDGPWSAKRVEP